jgi:hypothetical protein
MSVLWRILSVAALAVSVGILILSIRSVRREQRVRPGLDLLRLGVTLATTLLMARLLGVTTSEALMGLGFLVGLLLGVYEGLHLRVRFLGKGTFARRTALGVAAWGLGVVVVQAAGVVGRIGLADFGLALSALGVGQVVGLLTGRWQTVVAARRGPAVALAGVALVGLALAVALLPGLGSPAVAADAVDVRLVMAGQVAGVTVEVRGNGGYYGPALSLTFTNETGAEVAVTVPVGLQFVPGNEATQTMIAAGGETIGVPPTERGSGYTTEIQAFCGQYHDAVPSPEDVFSAGEVVTGETAAVIAVIHVEGVFGRDEQEALWQVTDGYDISDNSEAAALVEAARETGAASPVAAVDDDPENRLLNCADRVGFGDLTEDRVRCFTFRYDIPEGGIDSAVVYLSIEAPTGSLQDTDSVGIAVGTPFSEQCGLAGDMPGCVSVHGGFAGGERSLTVDLLDLACDAGFQGSREMQDAVRLQLQTGVIHMILQDDTAVHGARLALNEGPPALPCGTSTEAAPAPCHCNEGNLVLSAGEGARTSIVGLGGAAALLLTALAGTGNTVGSLAVAWRRDGWRGVRDLAGGGTGGGAELPSWSDPQAALTGGRAGAALERLPAEWRARVQEALAGRLEAEQTDRLVEAVGREMGPLDPAVDPGEALAANPKASALLAGVPTGARGRFEEKLLAGMHEQRVAGAAEEAARALRRDRAVELLRGAIARRDGTSVQQVLAAVGEDEGARVWPRAAAGLGIEPGDLEYPPPAPGGTAGSAPLLDLGGYLDAEADLAGALPGGGEAEAVLSRLPAGVRSQVEGRLAERLEAERVSRWVDKLRGAAGGGAGSGPVGGSVLEMPEARRLLGLLPPGIRDRVGTAAGRLLDGEAVERLAATARRLVEQDRAADLLRAALGLGDGDGADAILEAVGAALEVADENGLERLVQRVTQEGTAGLAALVRRGAQVPAVDLSEHLAGEADLLAAVRRVGGVEEVLQRAGSLRPGVEAELVRVLEAGRVGRVVRRAAELVGPGERAASDVLAAVGELPGVRELLNGLPAGSRREAYRLLGERLEAERLEVAVEEVGRALRLDQAEGVLRRAAAAGDLDAADRALGGLSAEQAQEVSAAAFGG